MTKTTRLLLCGVLLLILFAPPVIAAGLSPMDLRCDYRVNPLGVDSLPPRLFWKLQSGERGQHQTAYEILAASSEQKLRKDTGDLWASGRVNSDETIQIPYGGGKLSSSQPVFWKVRVWDAQDKVSAWRDRKSTRLNSSH